MTSPKVIMLDEPSLGLSPKYVEIVFERLLSLRDEGMTVVMVRLKGLPCTRHFGPRICDAPRAGRF